MTKERTRTLEIVIGQRLKAEMRIDRLALRLAAGKQAGKGVEVTGPVVVGRDRSCELVIADPSVSGRHAEIRPTGDRLSVMDLGSTNGTYINDVPVKEGSAGNGDSIKLGEAVIKVESLATPLLIFPQKDSALGAMTGQSEAMRLLFGIIKRIAPTDLTVLIRGETGTGKELVARTLHDLSPRVDGPFVPVDCASLTPSLAASELFGHEKGSFTGAAAKHRGAFERASGGTLFLDEVGELPPEIQSQLLRVLETRCFTPVGGEANITVDVRVVAATHRDLAVIAGEGDYREDLYYRLDEVTLQVPPLRDRAEDIPLLVDTLQKQLKARLGPAATHRSFTSEALEILKKHDWPGNVRELRNFLARTLAAVEADPIGVANLPSFRTSGAANAEAVPLGGSGDDAKAILERSRALEIQAYRDALGRARGNKAKAARELGLAISTFKDRLKKLGVNEDEVGE